MSDGFITKDSGERTSKATNPKDAMASGKVPFHTVPPAVVAEIALALAEGARKYGGYNWRKEGVLSSVYYSAALRHLGAWFEGEDTDPDSGLSHVTKAIAGLVVLRDAMIRGNVKDDRPPKTLGCIRGANELMLGVVARYPDSLPPITELQFDEPTVPVRRRGHRGAAWEGSRVLPERPGRGPGERPPGDSDKANDERGI